MTIVQVRATTQPLAQVLQTLAQQLAHDGMITLDLPTDNTLTRIEITAGGVILVERLDLDEPLDLVDGVDLADGEPERYA